MKGLRARAILAAALLLPGVAMATDSTCFGTVAKGRLENGVVLAGYRGLEKAAPQKRFVYGETGWKAGGRIRPHRTHQNGLSVDFMVPVLDRHGRSVPLPTSALNRFGYDLEFDAQGRYGDLQIDFPAIAEHLYQLDLAARAQGVGIALVIFDPSYLPRLWSTERGPYLKQNLRFMKAKPWVRHDEHYHVDFAIECRSLAG